MSDIPLFEADIRDKEIRLETLVDIFKRVRQELPGLDQHDWIGEAWMRLLFYIAWNDNSKALKELEQWYNLYPDLNISIENSISEEITGYLGKLVLEISKTKSLTPKYKNEVSFKSVSKFLFTKAGTNWKGNLSKKFVRIAQNMSGLSAFVLLRLYESTLDFQQRAAGKNRDEIQELVSLDLPNTFSWFNVFIQERPENWLVWKELMGCQLLLPENYASDYPGICVMKPSKNSFAIVDSEFLRTEVARQISEFDQHVVAKITHDKQIWSCFPANFENYSKEFVERFYTKVAKYILYEVEKMERKESKRQKTTVTGESPHPCVEKETSAVNNDDAIKLMIAESFSCESKQEDASESMMLVD